MVSIPSTQRVIYARNPIRECLCQFRFHDILRIQTDVPADFQDEIRSDFPKYSRAAIDLPPDMPPEVRQLVLKQVQSQIPVSHQFTSEGGDASVLLNSNSLTFRTTNYSEWLSFFPKVVMLEDALLKVYKPKSYTRVGLRYVNVVLRSELELDGSRWSELIKPEFCGLLSTDVETFVRVASSETRLLYSDPKANVTIRSGLKLLPVGSKQEEGFVLDFDFGTVAGGNDGDYREFLDGVHGLAGNIFRWAIHDKLSEALGRAG